MNHPADQWRQDNDSGERKRRGFFRRLMRRFFFILGGIAVILLAVFWFYPYRNAPMSLLSNFKTGPKVFRTKIPEEIKIAQNLFRGKFPAVDLPVNPPTKNESIPPVEKIAVPTLPADAAPEKSEPRRETLLAEPLESQTKLETTPPVLDTATSESIFAPPEQVEPLQETALVEPLESQTMIETTSSLENAMTSQPIDAPSEKSEVRLETEPQLPAEAQLKIETLQPAEEQTEYFQPTAALSEQGELPQKDDLRLSEIRPQPFNENVTQNTEKRIIHSEKWLLSQKSSNYTIQLMGARREVLLFNFVERNQLLKQNEIAYYQTSFKNKPWFQLLYGVYSTKKDAQSAADNLPPKIRKSSPWIRRLSAVQRSIRNRAAP